MDKSQINAISVTLPLLGQVIWGDTWKHTVKSFVYANEIFSANENGRRKKLCSVLLKCWNWYWFFLPSRPIQCLSIQFLSMSIFLLENHMWLRSWINYWLIGQMKIQRYTNTALPEIPNTDLLISFIELGQIYCLDQHCQQQLI